MSEISTLTIKIPLALKEQIREAALQGEHSLSAEVCARLEESFIAAEDKKSRKVAKVEEPEIDNQHLGENTEPALTQKELKKLRQLINKAPTKTHSKKK
ncbi:hypothetical protein [Rouxiella badensis]|jgi:hypothetical protein|uniref:Arc-like DNA binding domain-containing protein n=1 Tax=Rouxiella badensis TaxID=1646377 RepID=A0A1X0W9H6_9GAMM|nr:hypothetical protein [Rouxiella badensis]MCC3701500.1 hypothetical protein [Rouxiella badensis]MCC3717927.1 hypothetical protein [Rouxiella badensis]MCC3730058.1 hypothetical protein [Rouxiella badensis]MCC3734233.1 hypothetical protein [Rouxiella badensis]MCC3739270.1 hypothetical protein [Rouxiella badensis]